MEKNATGTEKDKHKKPGIIERMHTRQRAELAAEDVEELERNIAELKNEAAELAEEWKWFEVKRRTLWKQKPRPKAELQNLDAEIEKHLDAQQDCKKRLEKAEARLHRLAAQD